MRWNRFKIRFKINHKQRKEKMKTSSAARKSFTVALNPQQQSLESIQFIVANILGRAGCRACGRLATLNVSFLGDPPPELSKAGVISVETQGF